jgi:hypothetical protein
MRFSRQVEIFLCDTGIQEKQAQQRIEDYRGVALLHSCNSGAFSVAGL